MESVDVLIVGAGIGGLCAAKTYLELAPQTRLVVLEEVRSIEFPSLDYEH